MENEEYFSKNKRDYEDAIAYSVENSREYVRSLATELDSLLHGNVADFGNGGIIFYDSEKLDSVLCVDIANDRQERREGNRRYVHGDFYEFEFPADLDCALAQYLLHHLPDDERLAGALQRLSKALGARGRFVVVETLLPRYLEVVQSLLGTALNALLGAIERPSLRFFSLSSLSRMLVAAGFETPVSHRIRLRGWVSPAPVLFPRLRMPGWLYPLRIVVIEARGGSGS